MVDVNMSLEEYLHLIGMADHITLERQSAVQSVPDNPFTKSKPKRKVSKYNREFGRQLKALKKKHPRSKSSALMKRAHALTRKALK